MTAATIVGAAGIGIAAYGVIMHRLAHKPGRPGALAEAGAARAVSFILLGTALFGGGLAKALGW